MAKRWAWREEERPCQERRKKYKMDSVHSQRSIFKRSGLQIFKRNLGSRQLVAYLWDVSPFQEQFECSGPKMLSLGQTWTQAGPEAGFSPQLSARGLSCPFLLCIWYHFSRLQLICVPKRLDEMILIFPFTLPQLELYVWGRVGVGIGTHLLPEL